MTEIYANISQETKDMAKFFWDLAMTKNTVLESVEILDNVTKYFQMFGTPEEVEFLQFYFNMRMEMMKND